MAIGLLGSTSRNVRGTIAASGFMLGTILPDLDFALLIPLYAVDRELAISFHRSFSHSLVVLAACVSVAWLFHRRYLATWQWSLACAAGMFVHIFLDLFMWCASVRLLWPWPGSFGVYEGMAIDDIFWNISFAFEPIAYSAFLIALQHRIAQPVPPSYRYLAIALALVSIGLMIPAMKFTRLQFEPIAYGVAILCGFLPSMFILFRNRQQLYGDFVDEYVSRRFHDSH